MSLIYPEEAWARFGPAPIAVHDARGRRLRHVVGCNPATGEVIQLLPVEYDLSPMLIQIENANEIIWEFLLTRFRILRPRGGLATRHYFAPAPLTITRAEGP